MESEQALFGRKAARGVLAEKLARERSAAPQAARLTILVVAGLIGGAIVWAGVAEVGELARAEGEIAPTGELLRVDHLDGGVVAEILVREGEPVLAGAPLARLEQPRLRTERDETVRQLDSAQAEAARLRAVLAGEVPVATLASADPGAAIADYAVAQHALHRARMAMLGERIEARRAGVLAARRLRDNAASRVELNEGNVARMEALSAKGLVSEVQMTRQRDVTETVRAELIGAEVALADAETALAEAEAALSEADLAYREENLKALYVALQEVERLSLLLEEVAGREGRLIVRAPEAGIVQTAAYGAAGEVVPPGGAMFEILPTDQRLVAIIRLSPDDIGHVAPGQAVVLKPTTYDARRYGDLTGRIESISPTSVTPEQKEPYFRTVVALDDDHIGSGAFRRPVRAGLVVSAEIQTARRTVLEYLLKPIERSLNHAMTER